ncbi:MAG: 6,7-dimethyl-8-ribityllumazine synthase [Planctomycetia bacterium]|jgi:6,7-dimethyl-8-ribityllumazine synthase|nr:6,7-dimethyl-8-ribityllumazine synthase [Planctomycetia bacterium]
MRLDAEAAGGSEIVRGCLVHPASGAQIPVGTRVAVAVSRYNEGLTGRLLEGAVATLVAAGVAADRIEIAWVPGAFELPLAADRLASSGRFAAVICLGVVIRGETSHDRHINTAVATGIEAVSRHHGLPVSFGVLTCETVAQADARAGGAVGNKGEEAAHAALAMIRLLTSLPMAEAVEVER